MTYTLTLNPNLVTRDVDQANIPNAAGNSDWQAYQKWLGAGNTPNPAPAPTLGAQAATYLAGGLTIASEENPLLNGTYDVLPPHNHTINAIITSIANDSGLPLGLGQVAIFDKSGQQHLFGTQEISDFAVAVRDFVQGVNLYVGGQADALPPNNVALESTALPANTAPPIVEQSGGELNCSQGDWSGVPKSFNYAWRMDWTTSVGEDAPTYVLVVPDDVGHEFNCVVTASNVLGSAQASSNSVTAVDPSSREKESKHGTTPSKNSGHHSGHHPAEAPSKPRAGHSPAPKRG